MYLVERDEQLLRLEASFRRGAVGTGGAALIEGAPSAGKTELLHRAVQDAGRAGALVLNAACSAAEHSLPFGVFEQLLHSVRLPDGLAAQAAGSLQRAAARAPQDTDGFGTVGPELARSLRELTLPLLELAEGTAVVIAVDDVHWADAPSLHCLLYLVRRLRSTRITMVLTASALPAEGPESPSVRTAFRAELLGQPHCESMGVAPLSHEGALRMARAALGQRGADRLAEDLADAGGNPLLLRALIEDVRAGGAAGYGDSAYVRAVLSLIHRGSPPGLRRTAQALAVLGDDASPDLVAQLVGVEADAAAQCLDLLTGAGLLSGGVFRRDAARRGILAALPVRERATLRLRAAQLLHDHGADGARVTRLLLSCGLPPQPWAVPVLLESAERDRRDAERQRAVATLELALEGCADERERATVRAALAAAQFEVSPAGSCAHLDALVCAAEDGHLGVPDTRALLHQSLWHGRHDAARRALATLRARAGGDPTVNAGLLDTTRWIAWAHPGVTAAERAIASPPPQTGPELWLRPTAHLLDALTRGRPGEAVARAEQVLTERCAWSGDLTATATTCAALTVLVAAGRAGAAAQWCDLQLPRPARLLAPAWRALLHAVRAEAALHLGDLHAAREHSGTALDALPPASWGVVSGLPLSVAVLTAVRTGHLDEAAELLARPVPAALFETRYGLQYLYARGRHHLAAGRPHAALADFHRCGELMRAWGVDVPGVVPWRTAAAECWFLLGRPEEAAKLTAEQLATAAGAPADRGRALRLRAAAAPLERRLPLLTEALEVLESCGDQYEPIGVLMDLGEVCHRLGDSARARAYSRRARRMAEVHGAAPPAVPSVRPGALPAGDPAADPADGDGAAVLTESEIRVAALAVRGHTNREIATRLFVSASTVEQHLTRVYRKLGVRSRKELPTHLPGSPAGPHAAAVLAS
ncbi:AAA family ATPase [Streptomyces sp. bgisy159]|uniref:AAA family ATPase n=1 Tax=Streptomyces sp. bgisy159 TaxID=3413795 RepID=UPI003F49B925